MHHPSFDMWHTEVDSYEARAVQPITYCNHQFSCHHQVHGLGISISGCLHQFPIVHTHRYVIYKI